jgi:hypothetical protein
MAQVRQRVRAYVEWDRAAIQDVLFELLGARTQTEWAGYLSMQQPHLNRWLSGDVIPSSAAIWWLCRRHPEQREAILAAFFPCQARAPRDDRHALASDQHAA